MKDRGPGETWKTESFETLHHKSGMIRARYWVRNREYKGKPESSGYPPSHCLIPAPGVWLRGILDRDNEASGFSSAEVLMQITFHQGKARKTLQTWDKPWQPHCYAVSLWDPHLYRSMYCNSWEWAQHSYRTKKGAVTTKSKKRALCWIQSSLTINRPGYDSPESHWPPHCGCRWWCLWGCGPHQWLQCGPSIWSQRHSW